MATFKTINQWVDLETGEILFPFDKNSYYIVKKIKTKTQPERTKAFFVIKILNLCRKKNQLKML